MAKIEDGRYRARALSAELGKTKAGKPSVCVKFEILEEPNEGDEIHWFGYFSEKTYKRTLEALRHCGWRGQNIANLTGIDGTAEVSIVIEAEEYEGKWRSKVQWVNAPGGAGGGGLKEKMSQAEAQTFSRQMAGLIAQFDAESAAEKETPPWVS